MLGDAVSVDHDRFPRVVVEEETTFGCQDPSCASLKDFGGYFVVTDLQGDHVKK
jgi:hypothetical protein